MVRATGLFCFTCKKQVKILDQAENEFKDVLFLSFEQNKDKDTFINKCLFGPIVF